ncbi:copper chaperone PCu(A)C [Azohydromonas caseinilytica]|uniref:Copper chaperone PCu(A)C n=1 Tax=Azohydromonas caseinilytica TaxID=2728836 RepID=A0A848FG96_9BURK|nr:copper chaperone PCu(A)C [Azohydromonas caseinilytica]NML16901.1 copper chaperone PCu(A)C [Azohydromonas caseinilytica]
MPVSSRHLVLACAFAALSPLCAQAHVTLPPGGATAGSVYPASFRVGHACKDAASTTAIRVRLPESFTFIDAQPRPGWTLSSGAREVSWKADSAQAALPANEKASFTLRGRLADKPGTLWFKVLQSCDQGSADWAEIPAGSGPAPEFPAARLDVLPAGVAPVEVRDAWARPTVPGQGGTGVYAKLTAGAGSRLVGGSTPVAERVEVHQMSMEGNVMRMRELAQGLELPPGQGVELAPGGVHLMVTGLKQALAAGTSMPLTLRFVDRDGRESTKELQVPVQAVGPGGAAGAAGAHRH